MILKVKEKYLEEKIVKETIEKMSVIIKNLGTVSKPGFSEYRDDKIILMRDGVDSRIFLNNLARGLVFYYNKTGAYGTKYVNEEKGSFKWETYLAELYKKALDS